MREGRGLWDCRAADSCTPLDYTAPTSSKLNLDYLRRQFEGYSDQRLASNILEGVRLEAEVEMQIALHPNPVPLGKGTIQYRRQFAI